MTPVDALIELLDRVGASQGAPVLINNEELRQWPSAAVKAMKSQKLLARARPASSAICPGCERECVMPVHSQAATAGTQPSFVICDKRSDVNRVVIPAERLIQWQCSADLVCGFVATSLGLRRNAIQTDNAGRWKIGMAAGDKRRQMLALQADGMLNLVVESRKVPMAELIDFQEGKYLLDGTIVRQLVDASTTADDRYTPSNARREVRKLDTQAMHKDWQKAYRDLKKKNPNMSDTWISRKIAKMDIAHDHDSETIRKNMKK
jgi:hypothetical protein